MTWAMVGKSRSLSVSSRGMSYASRIAANDLGLLDRVDAEIGLEVEIEVQHVGRVAGLLRHDGEDAIADASSAAARSRRRRPLRFGRSGAAASVSAS